MSWYESRTVCLCLRCGYKWIQNAGWRKPRHGLPKKCARCKSPLWSTPRKKCGYGSKYATE